MDLLSQESKKHSEPSKKKMVLISLLVSIALFVIVLMLMFMMPRNTKKGVVFTVNEENKEYPENFIIADEKGNKYVEIKKLSEVAGYQYFNGEYLKPTEDKNKCYINNDNYIVGFENDSDVIYKTYVNSIIEFQEYKLKNKIISYNNTLYININDVSEALNLLFYYNAETGDVNIQTSKYIVDKINKEKEGSEDKTKIAADTSIENKNAIAYGMLVFYLDSKYGVANVYKTDEVLIGNKYNTLQFDEYTKSFIVSNANDKYGVIDEKGTGIIDTKYEDISIICYNPLLYTVKDDNKYGVIDKQGNTIIDIKYDEIGYTGNSRSNLNSVTIIKNSVNNKNVVVVREGDKYGLVSLSNQEVIIDCILDAVYSTYNDEGDLEYYLIHDGNKISLPSYIDKDKTKTFVDDNNE